MSTPSTRPHDHGIPAVSLGFRRRLILPTTFAVLSLVTAMEMRAQPPRAWPQWRGPEATGVAPRANPPIHWSETENVHWKTELPGWGHSTPITWDKRIFITTAIPVGPELPPRYSQAPGAHDNLPVTSRYQFVALALDRDDGRVLWRQVLHEAVPREAGHYTGSLASASPVTDGRRVVAHFGSHGLYCVDVDGRLLWKKTWPLMQTKHGHGEGSSPALREHVLVVNGDHEGQSFLVALDVRSGEERWKVRRDEVTSWATPIFVEVDGRVQVVVSGTSRVRGYDLETGREIWQCGGLSANVVASPVAAGGLVHVASSYDTRNMLTIKLDGASGDVTDTGQVLWSQRERTPYVPSPLLYGKWLYFLRHYQGILSRVEAATGDEPVGPFRLGRIRDVYASPVGAAGRVYVTGREGTTQVISHEEIPRLLAVNSLDDSFSASAAIVGKQLFLRGRKHLYCLAEPARR